MFLANYHRNLIHAGQFSPNGVKMLPGEAAPLLVFMEEIMRFEGSSRDVITQMVGPYIFDYFTYTQTVQQ